MNKIEIKVSRRDLKMIVKGLKHMIRWSVFSIGEPSLSFTDDTGNEIIFKIRR